ncbi:hypothetical protein DMUE_4020 [Dictyocoela muelleri]|nr:hypothetical protein EQH57_0030 [Dictyocoela roeselum]KAG0436844.1 hypothetical protein DMUE_4020 [Dictyocoela muelleri]
MRDNTTEAAELHRLACRTATRLAPFSKRAKEKNIVDNAKENSKDFYRFVNNRRITRDSVGLPMDGEGLLRTQHEDMASVLDNFFCSVFTVEGPGYERVTVYAGKVSLNDMCS